MNVVSQQKIDAIAVKEMINTKGWKIVEDKLLEKVNSLQAKWLKNDNGFDEDWTIKSEIRAISSLLNIIKNYASIK